VREEPEILREVSQSLADPLGAIQHRLAVERRRAGRGLEEAGKDSHQRRLARPVGSQQAEHAAGDIEVDSHERRHGTGVDLHEVVDREHGFLLGFARRILADLLAAQG